MYLFDHARHNGDESGGVGLSSGWRRYGKPLEAEAQAAAEQAEAEGRKHPGVPDDKAQRNFTDTESRIMHLEERTSCKRTTVRRWWTALTR